MATTTPIALESYLENYSYTPDVEYLDGELQERPVVSRKHGRLQSILSAWFDRHEEEWDVEVAVEVRTRVSSTRVRLPDVVVDWAGDRPEVLVQPPLLVIEILSERDSYSSTQRLASDYVKMGIPNIWLIDPETRSARVCEGNAWTEKKRLEIAETAIYVDVDELFARLERVKRRNS